LLKKGFRNVDLLIASTGLNEDKLGALDYGVSSREAGGIARAVEHASPEAVKLAFSLGAPVEHVESIAFAAAHVGEGNVRKALSLGVSFDVLGSAAHAVKMHGVERVAETLQSAPSEYKKAVVKALAHPASRVGNVVKAVEWGVAPEHVEGVSLSVGRIGVGKTRRLLEVFPAEHVDDISLAAMHNPFDVVVSALKKVPSEHLGAVARLVSPGGAELDFFDKASAQKAAAAAHALGAGGELGVRRAAELGFPFSWPVEFDASDVRTALALGVSEKHVEIAAKAVAEQGAAAVRKKLSSPFASFEADFPVFGLKNARENAAGIRRVIAGAEKSLRQGGSVSRNDLIKTAASLRVPRKQAAEFFAEKESYSLRDLGALAQRLYSAEEAQRLKKQGVSVFPAKFELVPFAFTGANRAHAFTLVMYPRSEQLEEVGGEGKEAFHVPGALAYARFYASEEKIVVSELQSDLHLLNLPAKLRKKYEDWPKMLLLGVKEYAARKGFKQVWLTTAEQQLGKWRGLHPSTAFEVYARTPKKMGFALKETHSVITEGMMSQLFWVHDLTVPRTRAQKTFAEMLSRKPRGLRSA